MSTQKLAMDGGDPYRSDRFPSRVPFGDREVELVTEAIRSQNLFGLGGAKVTAFENEFADLYGVEHSVASTSGTSAIHVAIGTVNPDPGDEIITGPITDAGTIVPILYQNAIPVFADIDDTWNMDPKDVERKITDRTKAILVVHLFGNASNMEAMCDVAKRHGLPLIEDCSQAHVTKYKGNYLGTWGDLGCFSLQQSKHMTTGDGGMTITHRDDLSERMFLFRDKGWTRKAGWGSRSYAFLAPNYRMTELQAAVGLAQVPKVRGVVEKRMELGHLLSDSIRDVDGLTPAPVTDGSEHGYWSYGMRVDGWDPPTFAKALTAEGVGCGAGYIGKPIYLCMEACCNKTTFGSSHHPFDGCHTDREYEYVEGMCPNTEDLLAHIVTLSINENMSHQDALDVAGAIRKVAQLLPRRGQD